MRIVGVFIIIIAILLLKACPMIGLQTCDLTTSTSFWNISLPELICQNPESESESSHR